MEGTDATYIDGKNYANEIYTVDRDTYEKAGYNHGKFVNVAGRPVRDKYVLAFQIIQGSTP